MNGVRAVFQTWFGSLEFEFSDSEELKRKLRLVKAIVEEASAMGLEGVLRVKQVLEADRRSRVLYIPEKSSDLPNLLEGIVELSVDGPVIVAPEKARLSQYEAIGLVLYASEGQISDPKTITLLLRNSGIKVSNTSARLKEMAKTGKVFKPNPKEALWKLSAQGQLWVEKTILPKLREGIL
ncbi:hypothetical protein J7L70_03725 [Candidatus Bathyarchaeota archaeon]|nr:hypothetical protein [Candidatus Bathyarchaeota archaeon]